MQASKLTCEIAQELKVEVSSIRNLRVSENMASFDFHNTPMWCKLTKTGKVKKHSMRRDNS